MLAADNAQADAIASPNRQMRHGNRHWTVGRDLHGAQNMSQHYDPFKHGEPRAGADARPGTERVVLKGRRIDQLTFIG